MEKKKRKEKMNLAAIIKSTHTPEQIDALFRELKRTEKPKALTKEQLEDIRQQEYFKSKMYKIKH